jgi:CubicO group peptidase (beta-lactamase class C family)
MRSLHRTLVFLVLIAGLPAVARAQFDTATLDTVREAVRGYLRAEMDKDEVVGLSLALVDASGVRWSEGFGYADRTRKVKATADTLYTTGSVSQLFTAAAILQLVDAGALTLDQPLTQALPEFAIQARFPTRPITLRQLLTHHAGLPAKRLKSMWGSSQEPLAELVARLRDSYASHPPGTVFAPSYLGYDVLGRVLEVKTGQPFAEAMRTRLLEPLAMKHSGFALERLDATRLARGYWKDNESGMPRLRDAPAIGLTASVAELAHFLEMLIHRGEFRGKPVLSKSAVAEMLRPQNAQVALDFQSRTGLGWRLTGMPLPNARVVAWESAGAPIVRGRMVLVPEQGLGLVILANSSTATRLTERAARMLLAALLEPETPIAEPEDETPHAVAPAGPAIAPHEFAGHYVTIMGYGHVAAEGETARVSLLNKTFGLEPTPEGLYGVEYRLLGLVPIPIPQLKEAFVQPVRLAGRELLLAHYKGAVYRIGERIRAVPVPERWRARLGVYEPAEPDPLLTLVEFSRVRLDIEHGLLMLRYDLPGWLGLSARVPLKPLSDSESIIYGTGWIMGETVDVVMRDGEERLRYAGLEFRRVKP